MLAMFQMVTLKIGHNDVCSEMCYLPQAEDIIVMMREGLRGALDYFSKYLPRTIVNVVPISSTFDLYYNIFTE